MMNQLLENLLLTYDITLVMFKLINTEYYSFGSVLEI